MKTIARSILLHVFLLLFSSHLYAKSPANDTIFFRGNMDYPPYQLMDKDKNPDGFSIDLLNAIGNTMGLNIHIELGPWDEVREQLEQGDIDGLAAMSYSIDRSRNVSFSTPYIYLTHAIFVRKSSDIKNIDDIQNKEIIVVNGDIIHDYLIANKTTESIIPVENYQSALRLLSAGKYDCAIINKLQGQFAINKYKLTNLKPVGDPLEPREMCFAVNKNKVELLAKINDGLQILKATGEYQDIYDKWFAVYEKTDINKKVFRYIFWILIPFIIFLAIILTWSWSLRRQVASKTSQLQSELKERKRTERELLREKALMNSMIHSIPDLIFYKDKNNIYIGCNKAFADFNGLTIKNIVGKTDFEIFPKNQAEYYAETDTKIIKNNSSVRSESWEMNAKGEKILLDVLKVPFHDKNNEPLGLVGICHDITERYYSEIDLKKSKEKAEESDRLKSSFLANMSHEIRTPMNAIIGFSDLLVTPELESDEREELVSHINNNCNTLLHLIDDIIDLAKIEANELVIEKQDVNVDEALKELHETVNESRSRISKENVDLILNDHLADAPFILKTDGYRLKQIISNLLDNSVKYTESGIIEFGYDRRPEIGVVEFYVRDTGIGIPKVKQEVIFQRFSKIESDKTKLFRGTGLGLAISKNLVEHLDGSIRVESEPGEGSLFTFTLPLTEKKLNEKKQEKNNNQEIEEGNIKGITILIAEDEDSNFRYLKMVLEKNNAKVLRAFSGKEAIEICKEMQDLDLVLMDIKMPQVDGLEATSKIKKFRPDLPIIAQTAYAMKNDRKQGFLAGCDDYLSKPIHRKVLLSTISKWLQQ